MLRKLISSAHPTELTSAKELFLSAENKTQNQNLFLIVLIQKELALIFLGQTHASSLDFYENRAWQLRHWPN